MTAAAPATTNARASWLLAFWHSAIGKKAVMAVTGVFLFGWIFLHMAGNLKVYTGPEHYNAYAAFLITMGAPLLPAKSALYAVRALLLIAVWLHIQAATQLTLMNRRARPVGYAEREFVSAGYAARTMRWGGVIIVLFVIYHLLHMTFGTVHPDFIEHDVYHNFVTGFQVWWVSAFYIVANLALGMHLYHGLWSMFNSLGLSHDRFNPWKRVFATVFAVVVTLVNISFPIAVLMGVLR
ncbi:MAG TPA: succinate dehydrogenase cytochrome b subunit [Thermoanaerobaculia bacterium]|jgi:succinate dehydrogenase / fumarate reductase cytochrome b subunit|nr:succinate dehydrogenase cytochrome b subunit [Thermoanaerobaculia bacterium]